MSGKFEVKLSKLINEFELETMNAPQYLEDILINCADVNRPGLHFAGFYDYFDKARIQVMGLSEITYLNQIPKDDVDACIEKFFSHSPACVILTRNLTVSDTMLAKAKEYQVPFFRTSDNTSEFIAALIATLNVELAPRITRHGVLVEVYGEGLLLFGESGVGKSEAAIELIKRGHRLIADDAVEIRRVSNRTLIGTSPENIRHFLELRGIGIINARKLFGIGSVKVTEKIDLIVNLEQWDSSKVYDRMGMETQYTEILGIQVPSLTIPVKPGRNLAVIIEVAGMNNRQKKMGYNSAQELMNKLGMNGSDSDANW